MRGAAYAAPESQQIRCAPLRLRNLRRVAIRRLSSCRRSLPRRGPRPGLGRQALRTWHIAGAASEKLPQARYPLLAVAAPLGRGVARLRRGQYRMTDLG